MKIIVTGCTGRIGKELLKTIIQDRMEITGCITRDTNTHLGQDAGQVIGLHNIGVKLTSNLSEIIENSDIVIDFSTPEATLSYAQICAKNSKVFITGTTGLSEKQYQALEEYAQSTQVFYSPNMSTAVNWVAKLAKMTSRMFNEDFDIEIIEMHHRKKKDAPSGTALMYGKACADGRGITLEDNAIFSREGIIGERPKAKIGFSTIRGGSTIGEHKVIFAGDDQSIEITHKSHSKKIYATGAINIAKWLISQPHGKLYSMEQYLLDI